MSVDYRSIGSRIRQLRRERNFTQAQLAEKLSVTPEYISRVERATTNPSLQTLSKLARLLGVNLTFLLEGTLTDSDSYKLEEFSELIRRMSAVKRKLLYEIANVISESDIL
jgi:transcriptional regulator with XRE-family HTH domain